MATQQAELVTEQAELPQTELIEKLTCLEFETSQLNRAYQLWRPYVEQEAAPDWMAAAVRITFDALIKFYLDVASTILPDVPHMLSAQNVAQFESAACEISDFCEEESTTAEPSPELLPMTEPDWPWPEMPLAISPPSTGDAISEQPAIAIQHVQREENGTIAEPSPELLPMPEPDWAGREMPVAIFPPSTGDEISEQFAIQQVQQEAESMAARPSPKLLPMPESDLARPETPVAILPPSTGERVLQKSAIQKVQPQEEAGTEPEAIHSLATLAKWLQGSSTGIFFFIPPGAMGRLLRASVTILI